MRSRFAGYRLVPVPSGCYGQLRVLLRLVRIIVTPYIPHGLLPTTRFCSGLPRRLRRLVDCHVALSLRVRFDRVAGVAVYAFGLPLPFYTRLRLPSRRSRYGYGTPLRLIVAGCGYTFPDFRLRLPLVAYVRVVQFVDCRLRFVRFTLTFYPG